MREKIGNGNRAKKFSLCKGWGVQFKECILIAGTGTGTETEIGFVTSVSNLFCCHPWLGEPFYETFPISVNWFKDSAKRYLVLPNRRTLCFYSTAWAMLRFYLKSWRRDMIGWSIL